MNKIILAGLKNKDKVTTEDKFSDRENSLVEIIKEEQECPNCHLNRLKKIDGEISCPVCGYGHKRCG